MELAARYTDHETVGGTTSWKAAVSWYPIEDLQVRTSLNQAVRAPSINDLYLDFGDQDLLTPPTFLDPCSAAGFDGSASVEALCIATGVPADRVGSADLNVTAQGIPGYYGGNAETQEETGNTLTVGLVWTPYSIEGLSASIDYFDIEVEDYIGRLPGDARTQITQCYFPENGTAEANAYCAAAERDVAGVLTRVNAGNTNIATHSINGFDFAINKSSEFLGGVLDASYVASYIREKKYSVDGTDLAVDCAGKFNVRLGGNACARPVTNLKHRATLFWSRDAYSLQLTWRHLSSVDDGNEDLTYTFEKISAYDTVDLGGVYEFQNGFTLIAGARNLLDKSPPILGENSFEANTYPNLYDLFGRTIYARATYSL
jgi:outer membrane receptor protein involved in Fe transport